MFILKLTASAGAIKWAKRYGGSSNDKAYSVLHYSSSVYVGGSSDSTNSASSKTDMVFLKLDESTGTVTYAKYAGGPSDDYAKKVYAHTDDYVYVVGSALFSDCTYGTFDIVFLRFQSDGTLDFLKSIGGNNADYPNDMLLVGSYVYITGYSWSTGLTNGFYDVVVTKVLKDSGTISWIKYIGTKSFNEYGTSLTALSDGSIFILG